MARKKTRSADGGSENNDSPEKFESKGNCPHIVKGVDIGGLKKAWKKKDVSCNICKKRQLSSAKKVLGVESDLFICMNCGHVGCGSGHHDHAAYHFNTPHSDCHSLVAHIDSWSLRCLQCRSDINLDQNAKAADAIAFLKKHVGGVSSFEETTEDSASSNIGKKYMNNQVCLPDNKSKHKNIKELKVYPMLGLENIGNTCYLNSILQCLAQTPRFVKDLESVCESKSHFHLPGGEHLIQEEHGSYLPPLEGVLGEGGQLSKAVYRVLHRVRNGARLRKTGTANENPEEVIRLMKKLTNTFYIGEQHDSHELLRFLLEGLRTEDLKRYQRGILNAMGISTAAREVLPKERECLKAYKNQAILEKLAVERLFGGSFVSLLKCMECDSVTKSFETFMDISLPVESEKVKSVEKQAVTSDMRLSKYQQKKERRVARRSKKKNRGVRLAGEVTSAPLQSKVSHSSNESATDSEADIEDNLDAENVTCSIQDGVPKAMEADSSSSPVTSSTQEDYGTTVNVTNFREVSSESEKLYPYTELIFGPSSDRDCGQKLDEKCDLRPCDVQDNQVSSVVSYSSEPSPFIYDCSPAYEPGSLEQSPNEDFGSCEGSRGSPASSIEQADWDKDEEVKKDNGQIFNENILIEEVETSLQMSQEHDSMDVEPPEPFEFICTSGFKEEHVLCDSSTSYAADSLDEKHLGTTYKALDKDNSFEDVKPSTNGTDKEKLEEGLAAETNHVSDIFGADNQVIPDETVEVLVKEVDDVSENGPAEPGNVVGRSETQNNFSGVMEQLDGSESIWGTTLAPPSELESVVYSLEYCLRQFFNEEMLNDQNKIGCAHCTRLKEGRDPAGDEKLVLSSALKQLLFMKLPEVLTIHLKRFEVTGTRMSKITRKITFPLELDVSPYTSAKLETKQPQTAPCYHLYGVIEHSGHMSSGHYVAYVKVHEEIGGWGDMIDQISTADNLTLSDRQENMRDGSSKYEMSQNNKLIDKWYYVSDTFVKEISIQDVLAAEAYILFYRQQI